MRVGILGAGFMGSTHARAFHAQPDAEVAGIYAQSDRRARPLAEELGTIWTPDLERLIDDPSIDALSICLPSPQHRATTEAALAAGKHVLLEKPIAMTLEDADALVAAGTESDRVLMIAHVLRFWPEYVALHQLATSGDHGRPISGLAYRRQPFPAWSSLFAKSELTGGAVIDMLIHDYDALNWIFGAPRSVTARGITNPRSNGGWDQIQVLIDYDGSSALVDGGMMMPESYPFTSTLQVLCDQGALEYHFRAGGRSVEMDGGTNELWLYPNSGEAAQQSVSQQDAYHAEIAYFLDCVRNGTEPVRATPADARLALATAIAAKQSIEEGRTVEL